MPDYPIMLEPNIYQYDTDLYVWFDEAGMLGGASNYRSDIKNQMKRYALSLEGKGKIHLKISFETEEFNTFLAPGGLSMSTLNGDDLIKILNKMKAGIKGDMLDTAQYVYQDYVETTV